MKKEKMYEVKCYYCKRYFLVREKDLLKVKEVD
jgi:hypothetical protein